MKIHGQQILQRVDVTSAYMSRDNLGEKYTHIEDPQLSNYANLKRNFARVLSLTANSYSKLGC